MSKRQAICYSAGLAVLIAGAVTWLLWPGSTSDPLAGYWSDTTGEPLGMFLDLRSDRTFAMGDIDGGQHYPGLFGIWETKDNYLVLRITETESCKVQTGRALGWSFAITPDKRLVLKAPDGSTRRILTRTAAPMDSSDALQADR